MAHPYFHSISSVHRWGGCAEDYLPLHSWFDDSKQLVCDFRHRAIRHHTEGIAFAIRVFGETITNCDGCVVSTAALGERHVTEDLGMVPSAAAWFNKLDPSLRLKYTRVSTPQQSAASARKWGGVPEDYDLVHRFLDEQFADVQREHIVRHHSYGIFDCESVFGPVIANAVGRKIPVRVIAEQHVKAEFGVVTSTATILEKLQPESWMLRVAKPSRVILEDTGEDHCEAPAIRK